MMVVALYNQFVEQLQLKQSSQGLDSLRKAVQLSTTKLGSTHMLTTKMREVLLDVEERISQKASAERFRTLAGSVSEVPELFMHYQEGQAHPWRMVKLRDADANRAQEILSHSKQITLRRRCACTWIQEHVYCM